MNLQPDLSDLLVSRTSTANLACTAQGSEVYGFIQHSRKKKPCLGKR